MDESLHRQCSYVTACKREDWKPISYGAKAIFKSNAYRGAHPVPCHNVVLACCVKCGDIYCIHKKRSAQTSESYIVTFVLIFPWVTVFPGWHLGGSWKSDFLHEECSRLCPWSCKCTCWLLLTLENWTKDGWVFHKKPVPRIMRVFQVSMVKEFVGLGKFCLPPLTKCWWNIPAMMMFEFT